MQAEISVKNMSDKYDKQFIIDSIIYMLMSVPDNVKLQVLNDKNYILWRPGNREKGMMVSFPLYIMTWIEANRFYVPLSGFVRAAVKLYDELKPTTENNEIKEKIIDSIHGQIYAFYDGKKILLVHFMDYKIVVGIANATRTTQIQFKDKDEYEKFKQSFSSSNKKIQMVCELLNESLSRIKVSPRRIDSLATILVGWCPKLTVWESS